MAHALKHYKLNKDGSLRLVKTELVDDPPRPALGFPTLAYRDAYDIAKTLHDRERFESLADAACETEG